MSHSYQVFGEKLNRPRDAADMRQVRVGKHADVHLEPRCSGSVF
jgi:hypothetical protein